MQIPLKKIAFILAGVIIFLLGMYTWNVMAWHIIPAGMPDYITTWFDINDESSIPTWYATILLFLVAIVSYCIYHLEKKAQIKRPWLWFWLFFAIIYCFLSIDEGSVIHESIDNFTTFKWITFYAPVTFLFFLVCAFNFIIIRKEDRPLRNWVIGGLIVYAIGGLGCECLSFIFPLNFAWQHVEYVAEEGFEMLGSSMVLMGCLYEINRIFQKNYQWNLKKSETV